MKKLAPVALFCYRRPSHTQRVINNLLANKLSSSTELYIFQDGPKTKDDLEDVSLVSALINKVRGFKSINIIISESNNGLRRSIVNGLNSVFEKNESIIVVEDDVLVSKVFLEYMNYSLDKYQSVENVSCIGGFSYDVPLDMFNGDDAFFLGRTCSWGWASWKNRMEDVDWSLRSLDLSDYSTVKQLLNSAGYDLYDMLIAQKQGKIDTWDIQFTLQSLLQNRFTLYPREIFSTNIGLDGSGTHSGKSRLFANQILAEHFSPSRFNYPDAVAINTRISNHILSKYFNHSKYSFSWFMRKIDSLATKLWQ